MTQTHTHHAATFADLLTLSQGNTCEQCEEAITDEVRFCYDCGTAYQDAYYKLSCPEGFGQGEHCDANCPRICVCPDVG